MRTKLVVACIVALLLTISLAAQATITVNTSTAGDAAYYWNSKYGGASYTAGENALGVSCYFSTYDGWDRTIGIFEISLAELIGVDLTSASLVVDSLGFGTGYYYGSAYVGWLDTGTRTLTGDVVADNLGSIATAMPNQFTIYNSDYGDTPGLKSFDVLSYISADIAAGRQYSTFVMSSSRDTNGSIYAAESGRGPRIVAEPVPEPATMTILGVGLTSLLLKRRRKA